MKTTQHRYSVTVGNIGQVYDGTNRREARATFREYEDQSARGYGRAAAEPVTLWMDGEPIQESEPFSPARIRHAIAEIATFDDIRPAPQGYRDARDAIPYDALGDDYRRHRHPFRLRSLPRVLMGRHRGTRRQPLRLNLPTTSTR